MRPSPLTSFFEEEGEVVGVCQGDEALDVSRLCAHGQLKAPEVAVSVGIDVVGLDRVESLRFAEGDPIGHDRLEGFVGRADRFRPV